MTSYNFTELIYAIFTQIMIFISWDMRSTGNAYSYKEKVFENTVRLQNDINEGCSYMLFTRLIYPLSKALYNSNSIFCKYNKVNGVIHFRLIFICNLQFNFSMMI